MKFKNIEVSGITRIVIDHRKTFEAGALGFSERIHSMINHLKTDRRYRMWIHGDTLNIVKKNE